MTFQLWDAAANNLIAAFDTLSAALKLARSGAERSGRASLNDWALTTEDEEGEVELLAEGQGILDRPLPAPVA